MAAAQALAARSPAELAAADPPSAAAREAASGFVATLIRGDRHGAYESLHSSVRTATSVAEFVASLDLMVGMYGRVIAAKPKQEMLGVQESTRFGKQNMRKFTYAVTTTKFPMGTHFASVVVATDGNHVAPEAYQVFTFIGEIPPDLR